MSEFGGGLSRFRNQNLPPENTCREIVEVVGGNEWKIRKLSDIYDQYCWKYPGCSVIVNFHFNRLQNSIFDIDENQKFFYAQISHFMSPVEISVQPKYLVSARKSLMGQINAFYNSSAEHSKVMLSKEQVFPSVACAVLEAGIWYRGKVVQVSGREHVVVELVDIGTQTLVSRDSIRPLIRRFGRAPPLCLKCRVDGVSINDLETKDLLEFKNIVESCNALFRVELKSVEEPFLIDLYHPTISGKNMCSRFLPSTDDEKKIDRLERSWIAHCKKVNGEFDEDEDDHWNHHWAGDYGTSSKEKLETRTFIRRLGKCQRAPRFEKDELIVSHIENSQLIYLHYPWQIEMRNRIEDILKGEFEHYPRITKEMLVVDQACVVRIDSKEIKRCIITSITPTFIELLFVDYGFYVNFEKCRLELRLLPNEEPVSQEPMVTVVSLASGNNSSVPHHSETMILKYLVPRGTIVRFKWDKKTKNTPLRGLIFTRANEDILKLMTRVFDMSSTTSPNQVMTKKKTIPFADRNKTTNNIFAMRLCRNAYRAGRRRIVRTARLMNCAVLRVRVFFKYSKSTEGGKGKDRS